MRFAQGAMVGEPLVKRYWCQPFTLVVAGTLRVANLAGLGSGVSFGPHATELALFTEGFSSVALTAASSQCGGSVRYAVGGNVTASSAALKVGSQLEITGSTDIMSIACFAGGERIGRIWAAHFNSNLDTQIYGGNGTLQPHNNVSAPAPIPSTQRWELPLFTVAGNTTMVLRTLLEQNGASGIPANTSVKLTATVVGGGGVGSSAGDGGVATEVYWDLLTCFPVTIEVRSVASS